jgi:hypothetical protein
MMVNINIFNFYKGTSTLAMRSNGPLPQVYLCVHLQYIKVVLMVYHGIGTRWYKIENHGFHLYPYNLYLWQVGCYR